jgi:hypothetical protein
MVPVGGPSSTGERQWRCTVCGLEGPFYVVRSKPCSKAKVGDLSPDQQLAAWVDGRSICPSTTGECCPDFSCCRPKLQWPEAKRRQYAQASQGTREKMHMGALQSLFAAVGVRAHVTRGVPEDDD